MTSSYAAPNVHRKLQLSEDLTELVLEPIGRAWRTGELVVFARDAHVERLQERGCQIYAELLSHPWERPEHQVPQAVVRSNCLGGLPPLG